MSRKFVLTWQQGANGRGGRWKKKYKGKAYYFAGGRGKSDRDSYEAAVAEWEATKVKIDASLPRKHQAEYDAAIGEWERVLAWSNQNGEQAVAKEATAKVNELRKRLQRPFLEPLDRSDRFQARFENPHLDEIIKAAKKHPVTAGTFVGMAEHARKIGFDPDEKPSIQTGLIDSLDLDKEIWNDRLATQQRKAAALDDSVGAYAAQFLAQKGQDVATGEVTVGRKYALGLYVELFRDWIGKDTSVREINSQVLLRFHAKLVERVTSKEWSRYTANHYLAGAKTFVRWLWQIEAISELPRVLDGRSKQMQISKSAPKVVVFEMAEIKTLLENASDRTKLYILLMLNCGMTQKDISDLRIDEIDWNQKRIIRKRSKTADCERVPLVNYPLWETTFTLLHQERTPAKDGRAILNANGAKLCEEKTRENGVYTKTDNIKNAFDRLRKDVSINKSLKSLKKTSATLLRGNERFNGLYGLFLGHAPQSMSDKHYTNVPQDLFDNAVRWLGTQYGVA